MLSTSLLMTTALPQSIADASETKNKSNKVTQSQEDLLETTEEWEEEETETSEETSREDIQEEAQKEIQEETQLLETEAEVKTETEVEAKVGAEELAETLSETEVLVTETASERNTEEMEQSTETEAVTETESETELETEKESAENELSEAVKALQERINALPTVEEFEAMADGTTVEDSNLNQKQTDVYNEAQAIADALDQLSEEEQGQVDTSKLEALFEYFNSMTDETATTISPVTSGSKTISSGGTYTLKGGTYSTSGNSIIINTTSAVTLNIDGNITATSSKNAFINVQKACSNLTINLNGHTIADTGQSILINKTSPAIMTITGGTITGNSNAPAVMNTAGGTLTFRNVTVNNGCVNNKNASSTVNIEEGTVFNCTSSLPYGISSGIIRVKGGTINGNGNSKTIYSAQSYDNIEITGGSITGGTYGVYVDSASSGNVKIGGSAVLNNNTADVYLYKGKTFTVNENYAGKIKVALSSYPSSNTKQQITKSQSTDYQKDLNVVSANSSYIVGYNASGKYLYLWKHAHTWSYSASGNTVTAKCTSDSNCGYTNGLTLTLTAPDMQYTGSAYNLASITNAISSVTGASAGSIKYYDDANREMSTPINAGSYTAKVTIGGATASVDFKITKTDSTVSGTPVHPVEDLTYTGTDQTLVSADDITGGTIYYRVGENGTWQDTLPTGTDAGEYEIFYYVKGDANHENNGSEDEPMGSCKVTVTKKQITSSADGFEGIYDENASRSIQVKVTDPAEGYKITYSTTGEEGSYTDENPSFTEVGEYTVYYRVEAGNNYETTEGSATVKIAGATFAEGDITVVGYQGTYDGAFHKISVETKGNAAGATVTYSTTGEADSYTDEVPGFKNATDITQTVYYKVSKKGYKDVFGSVEVSIARKNVTATVSVKEKEYDGTTDADVTATVDTGIENETLTVSGIIGTFASKDVADNIEVSINSDALTVTAGEGTKAENYNVICEVRTSGKITAKPVTVAITANGGTYGSVKAAEAALDGVVEVDQGIVPVKLTYTGNGYDSTDVPTQAGTYTVTASIDNGNYVLTGNNIAKFVIEKATVIAPEIASKQYTGETQTADVADTELYTVTKNEGGQNAGSYPVILTLKDTNNYKWESTEKADLELTFKITPIQNTWTTEPSISSWIYGDAANAPEGSTKYGTVSVTYAKAGSEDFTSEVPTEAGTYTARFTVEGTDSYRDLSEDVTFTIAARPVTVTVDNKSITYGDVEPEYTSQITEGNLVGEDDLNLTYSRNEGTTAKTYVITAISANSNYKVCVMPGTLTIQKKEVQLTWSKTDLTFNGSEQSVTATVNNPAFDTDAFDLEYTGNTATDAGNYTAEVISLGNDNYVLTENSNQKVDWKIAKADAQYPIPDGIQSLVYNGTSQGLVTASNPIGGTLMYKVDDGDWSELIPAGLDAGTYTISYKFVGDENHNDSEEGQFTVTIAKREVVVSGITAEDKVYDGNTSATLNYDDVKFDGMLENDSLSITATGTFEDKNAGIGKKVTLFDLTLDGTSAKNYVLAEAGQQNEATAAIAAKEITVVITPNGGTYKGTITPATATLIGLVGEDDPEITLTYTGHATDGTEADGSVPTRAGTYTVTASIMDSNYSLKSEGASAEFVVAPAEEEMTTAEEETTMTEEETTTTEEEPTTTEKETTTTKEETTTTDEETTTVPTSSSETQPSTETSAAQSTTESSTTQSTSSTSSSVYASSTQETSNAQSGPHTPILGIKDMSRTIGTLFVTLGSILAAAVMAMIIFAKRSKK